MYLADPIRAVEGRRVGGRANTAGTASSSSSRLIVVVQVHVQVGCLTLDRVLLYLEQVLTSNSHNFVFDLEYLKDLQVRALPSRRCSLRCAAGGI